MRYFLIFIFLILLSCSSLKEAGKVLRNEKTNTTDEFLVKKRDPLVMPPNYEEIPEPGTILQKKQDQEDNIKNLLKATEVTSDKKAPSSVENSILNRIRK